MNNFWRDLILSATVRSISGIFIWLEAKGYITSGTATTVSLVVATLLFNVGHTIVTRLLARWKVETASLLPAGSLDHLNSLVASTPLLTKLNEAVSGQPVERQAVAALREDGTVQGVKVNGPGVMQ